MRLADRQLDHLAEHLLNALLERGAARLTGERSRALAAIVSVVQESQREEADLDREARRLLELHLAKAPAGIDAQKMLQMIKKKLAEERGVPL